jgi:hypothetical protein
MRAKFFLLGLTLVAFLMTGRAPGIRELRNPDAEQTGTRLVVATKRAWL